MSKETERQNKPVKGRSLLQNASIRQSEKLDAILNSQDGQQCTATLCTAFAYVLSDFYCLKDFRRHWNCSMRIHEFSWPADLRLEIEPDEYPGEQIVFVSESYKVRPEDKNKIIFRSREIAIVLFFSSKGIAKSSFYRFKKEFGNNKRFFLAPDMNKLKEKGSIWREWQQKEIKEKWIHGWSEYQKEVYEKARRIIIWMVGPLGESPLLPGQTNVAAKRFAWSIAASEADRS